MNEWKTKTGLNPCCNGIYLIIYTDKDTQEEKSGLNPCCNGIYLIIELEGQERKPGCLNPCCNGIYLIIVFNDREDFLAYLVLILVVMEYT